MRHYFLSSIDGLWISFSFDASGVSMSPMNILESPFDSLANLSNANKAKWKLIKSWGIRVLKTLFSCHPETLLCSVLSFKFSLSCLLETTSANGLIWNLLPSVWGLLFCRDIYFSIFQLTVKTIDRAVFNPVAQFHPHPRIVTIRCS